MRRARAALVEAYEWLNEAYAAVLEEGPVGDHQILVARGCVGRAIELIDQHNSEEQMPGTRTNTFVEAKTRLAEMAADAGRDEIGDQLRADVRMLLDRVTTYETLLHELVDDNGPEVDDIIHRIEVELAKP